MNDPFTEALALHHRGRIDAAAVQYAEALRRDPKHREALHMLGVAQWQLGHPEQALGLLRHALRIREDPLALSNLGMVLNGLERFDEALASCDRAIALRPDHAEAFNNRALALVKLRRFDEALQSFDSAIALNPGSAEAYCNRGFALTNLHRFAEALESCERAIALRPRYPEAFNNRAIALTGLQRHDEALQSYDRAIELNPGYAAAFTNRGLALDELRRFDEAARSHAAAIAIAPDSAEAHVSLAQSRLTSGDFETGWREYEWRWRKDANRELVRDFTQPQWTGAQDLRGRTILLHAEQGLGDTIQFCRYARHVAERGAKVVLEVPTAILPLMRSLAGPEALVERAQALPAFDLHCPLLSLPLAFGTQLASIPRETPYLFAEPAKAAQWHERLAPHATRRIGLAWSGSPQHLNDRRRSMPLALLVQALPPEMHAHCLQKEIPAEDRAFLASNARVLDHSAVLDDFADTAALITQLDLVISVDTSVAHLAAAMGKPTWLLLPHAPDWRWLTGRDDSPWYPTMRLFRQPAFDDWNSVVAAVRDALRTG